MLAAGDVRHDSVKRVASAVGEGSIAGQLLHNLFTEELYDSPRTHAIDPPATPGEIATQDVASPAGIAAD